MLVIEFVVAFTISNICPLVGVEGKVIVTDALLALGFNNNIEVVALTVTLPGLVNDADWYDCWQKRFDIISGNIAVIAVVLTVI